MTYFQVHLYHLLVPMFLLMSPTTTAQNIPAVSIQIRPTIITTQTVFFMTANYSGATPTQYRFSFGTWKYETPRSTIQFRYPTPGSYTVSVSAMINASWMPWESEEIIVFDHEMVMNSNCSVKISYSNISSNTGNLPQGIAKYSATVTLEHCYGKGDLVVTEEDRFTNKASSKVMQTIISHGNLEAYTSNFDKFVCSDLTISLKFVTRKDVIIETLTISRTTNASFCSNTTRQKNATQMPLLATTFPANWTRPNQTSTNAQAVAIYGTLNPVVAIFFTVLLIVYIMDAFIAYRGYKHLLKPVLNLTNIDDDIMYEIRVYVGSGISIAGTKCEIQLHIYGTLDVLGPVDLPVMSIEEDGIASFLISTNQIIGDIGSIGIFCKAMDLRSDWYLRKVEILSHSQKPSGNHWGDDDIINEIGMFECHTWFSPAIKTKSVAQVFNRNVDRVDQSLILDYLSRCKQLILQKHILTSWQCSYGVGSFTKAQRLSFLFTLWFILICASTFSVKDDKTNEAPNAEHLYHIGLIRLDKKTCIFAAVSAIVTYLAGVVLCLVVRIVYGKPANEKSKGQNYRPMHIDNVKSISFDASKQGSKYYSRFRTRFKGDNLSGNEENEPNVNSENGVLQNGNGTSIKNLNNRDDFEDESGQSNESVGLAKEDNFQNGDKPNNGPRRKDSVGENMIDDSTRNGLIHRDIEPSHALADQDLIQGKALNTNSIVIDMGIHEREELYGSQAGTVMDSDVTMDVDVKRHGLSNGGFAGSSDRIEINGEGTGYFHQQNNTSSNVQNGTNNFYSDGLITAPLQGADHGTSNGIATDGVTNQSLDIEEESKVDGMAVKFTTLQVFNRETLSTAKGNPLKDCLLKFSGRLFWVLHSLLLMFCVLYSIVVSTEWSRDLAYHWMSMHVLGLTVACCFLDTIRVLVYILMITLKERTQLKRIRNKTSFEQYANFLVASKKAEIERDSFCEKEYPEDQMRFAKDYYRLKGKFKDFVIFGFFVLVLLILTTWTMNRTSFLFWTSLERFMFNVEKLSAIQMTRNSKSGETRSRTEINFWNWLRAVLPPILNPKLRDVTTQQYYIFENTLHLVQKRVIQDRCTVPTEMQSTISECNVPLSDKDEDKRFYLPGWKMPANGLETYDNYYPWHHQRSNLLADHTSMLESGISYSLKGYVAKFNSTNIDETIDKLIKDKWIDKYTRLLYLETMVYDPSANLMAPVIIALEFSTTGYVLVTSEFFNFSLFPNLSPMHEFVQIAETLFFILTFYIVFDIMTRKTRTSLSWLSGWLIVEGIVIVLSYAIIIIDLQKGYHVYQLTLKSVPQGDKTEILRQISYLQKILEYTLANLNLFGIALFMKPLFTLGLFDDMYIALSRTLNDMKEIAAETAILIIAFTCWAYLAFVDNVRSFSEVSTSFPTLMDMLVRPDNSDLYSVYFYGPLLLFTYFCIMILFVSNIFISAVQRSYCEAREVFDRITRKTVLAFVTKKFRKKRGRHQKLLKYDLTLRSTASRGTELSKNRRKMTAHGDENGDQQNTVADGPPKTQSAGRSGRKREKRASVVKELPSAILRLEKVVNNTVRRENVEDQILIGAITDKWKLIVEKRPPMDVIFTYKRLLRKPNS